MSDRTFPLNTSNPAEVEHYWDAVSRRRQLSLEESLQLEWAITEQVNGTRRLNGRYVALRSRIEDLSLANKIEDEMVGPEDGL